MTHERTRRKQRTEKLLEVAQIKLSTVIADIFGVSGRAMLAALIAGERSPKALADLAHGTIEVGHPTLAEALMTGRFEEHPRIHVPDEVDEPLTILSVERVLDQRVQPVGRHLDQQRSHLRILF